MAFHWGFSTVFIISLCVSCTLPVVTFADDDDYFSTWELQHSGKYKLVWYYNSNKDLSLNQPNRVEVHDKSFVIHPQVRPPTINGVYLLEHSKVNEGEEVLDIGTGSGVHAIFAAENAKHVVATDIFAPAVENAKENARLHQVEKKIDFRTGDLFESIDEDEKFDVFFFNINYPFNPTDKERNKLHERLFSEIRTYMKPNARIYYQVSFVRNISYIYDLLNRNNFRIMEMHMEHMLPYKHEPLFMMIQSR